MQNTIHSYIVSLHNEFEDYKPLLVHCHLSSLNLVQPCSFTAVIPDVMVNLLGYLLYLVQAMLGIQEWRMSLSWARVAYDIVMHWICVPCVTRHFSHNGSTVHLFSGPRLAAFSGSGTKLLEIGNRGNDVRNCEKYHRGYYTCISLSDFMYYLRIS